MPTIIKAEEALYYWLSEQYPLITNRYSMTSMMGKRNDFQIAHPELQVDLTEMRRQFLAHLAEQCHYSPQQVSTLGLKVFMDERNNVNLYADVIPLFKRLSPRYQLASISNGNADVLQTAAAPYMAYSINAADVKAAKPDPKMFQQIERQAHLEASQCLYVGDDISIDIKGAKNAGWDCIWLNRNNDEWPVAMGQAVKIIQSLAEL